MLVKNTTRTTAEPAKLAHKVVISLCHCSYLHPRLNGEPNVSLVTEDEWYRDCGNMASTHYHNCRCVDSKSFGTGIVLQRAS
jgi:hypothetical protein